MKTGFLLRKTVSSKLWDEARTANAPSKHFLPFSTWKIDYVHAELDGWEVHRSFTLEIEFRQFGQSETFNYQVVFKSFFAGFLSIPLCILQKKSVGKILDLKFSFPLRSQFNGAQPTARHLTTRNEQHYTLSITSTQISSFWDTRTETARFQK